MVFNLSLSANQLRIAVLFTILLLLAPSAVAGVQTLTPEKSVDTPSKMDAQNVTFISSQHGSLVAVHTETKETIWRHDSFQKYYDVDQLNNSVVLISARTGPNETKDRKAIKMNWRTGKILSTFPLPPDTHDVDRYQNGTYVVADKANHRVYIYDPAEKATTWEFQFENHFPASAGGDYNGDWTHLNDVDVIENGSTLLVSPRNFDRVMLINVSTKEIEWTLGEEDNYEILSEQHNPALISTDPLMVLVADSENDRIVEYQRTDDGWKMTWGYRGNLKWPRDADRLPNGNTMIADSGNNRALVVTPDHEVVWERDTDRMTYDIERLGYGDEPRGPPMIEFNEDFAQLVDPRHDYPAIVRAVRAGAKQGFFYAAWVLPSFMKPIHFYPMSLAGLISLMWVSIEVVNAIPSRIFGWTESVRIRSPSHRRILQHTSVVVAFLAGIGAFVTLIGGGRYAGQLGGIGVLLFGIAGEQFRTLYPDLNGELLNRLSAVVRPLLATGCLMTGVGMWVIADPAGVGLYYTIGVALVIQAGKLATM